MLVIKIPQQDLWDEKNYRFIHVDETTLQLEHSLLAVSNWESKWNKSFFIKDPKTEEESIDYIKFMLLNEVDDNIFYCLSNDVLKKIHDYINEPMTATKIKSNKKDNKPQASYITSEIIYYWMISLNIPLECENWHINKLITLIRVCQIKSQPKQKMSEREAIAYQAKLNAERRAKLKSKG